MSEDIKMVQVEFKVDGALVGMTGALAKTFSTGSRGFHSSTKVEIEGKRYQVNVQLVEIGSKPSRGG